MPERDTNIDFAQVGTDDERLAMYRLRFHVYCVENKFLDAADNPNGLEKDDWDAASAHFIAKLEGEVVGTIRLVIDSPLGYPIESHFDVAHLRAPGRVFAELSRFIVDPKHRRNIFGISNGLMGVILRYSLQKGITDWCGLFDDKLYRVYRHHGYPLIKVGEASSCFGCTNSPYTLNIEDFMESLRENNPKMYEYMLSDCCTVS